MTYIVKTNTGVLVGLVVTTHELKIEARDLMMN